MALFKLAHLFRNLRPQEAALAKEVFHGTLPPLDTIGITNGLGKGNTVWTLDRSTFDLLQSGPPKSLGQLDYLINFGEALRLDLTSDHTLGHTVPGYHARIRDVFVHEMTHVWQFHHGYGVKSRSLWAQEFGAGYEPSVGDPWKTFNVEQQAVIVERWNEGRKDTDGKDHELFPYIHYIIRKEGEYKSKKTSIWGISIIDELWEMDLAKLTALWALENFRPD